ncbi:KAP family NTPase [Fructilactobacillus ixorae]|uniref:KAP family NTPase n=1 Tax=Fructilactobacillus ixorae TaxID=1750535 RepID=A0ABY5C5T6_9LACO|nr:P-loop NTPase fold protein [Fructilactobacillus ixorae]USS92958.1 KAP family NTPase [Fructilactobacillus ixorae]
MEKFDLQPTTDNLKESIIHDTTGRNSNVFHFLEMLNSLNGPWSIAIDGKWGTGKTFFVKQCQIVLDIVNKNNEDNSEKQVIHEIINGKEGRIKKISYKTVYYDAWKNDSEEDPIISLTKSIVSADSIMDEKIRKGGIEILKNLVKIAAKSIAQVDIDNYIDSLGSEKELSSEEQFNRVLTKLIPENGRLVIFVDELDRCQPTYAIKLLERIKHFFNDDKITFVFAVNIFELKNTVQKFYGNNFDGSRYLDRFFDFVIALPDANLENYYRQNDNFPNDDSMVADSYYKSVAEFFELSLREINHFYSTLNTAIYSFNFSVNSLFSNEKFSSFIVINFILPYLLALIIIDKNMYNKTVNGIDSANFISFFLIIIILNIFSLLILILTRSEKLKLFWKIFIKEYLLKIQI